jgi:hypothetical protein
MRYCLLAACALILFLATPARATEVGTSRTFGLGVQIGEPTGIVGKVFLGGSTAFDFGVGFLGYGWEGRCQAPDGHWYNCHGHDAYVRDRGYISAHADFLWEESFMANPFRLDWHAGVGARFIAWNDWAYQATALLARVPLGLDFAFRRPAWLEAYIEVAPGLMLIPAVDLWFDIGIGARAYF